MCCPASLDSPSGDVFSPEKVSISCRAMPCLIPIIDIRICASVVIKTLDGGICKAYLEEEALECVVGYWKRYVAGTSIFHSLQK